MATTENDNSSSSSHYALHVALQTMKERCQNLQKRLDALEEENLALRMSQTSLVSQEITNERRVSNQTEMEVMREKVSELSRQKIQLTDHISMVAAENRQLWSRLSKLTKDNQALDGSMARMKESLAGGSQNLIRSKTFTKNAPNPKLRDKLPREGSAGSCSSEEINLELEDATLLNKCGFVDNGTGAEMGFLQHDGEELLLFDQDSNPDAKRCIEGLLEIQKDLLRQQVLLKAASGKLQTKQEICNACKHKKTDGKPQMVDKTVEVGNDLPQGDKAATTSTTMTHSTEDLPLPEIPAGGVAGAAAKNGGTMPTATAAAATTGTTETEVSTLKYINILQEKVKADALDKMCPMCGKIFVNIPFDEFQEHVEGHFIDDNEMDLSLDRTYEYISQTVGNF
ncbi:protein spindle-F-like [Armigeres subalbatus]|uniref:protein spindle-F-like n=1 Tax=Armigeres subalbatus TaxID=124917 RepID=UPI002ED01936